MMATIVAGVLILASEAQEQQDRIENQRLAASGEYTFQYEASGVHASEHLKDSLTASLRSLTERKESRYRNKRFDTELHVDGKRRSVGLGTGNVGELDNAFAATDTALSQILQLMKEVPTLAKIREEIGVVGFGKLGPLLQVEWRLWSHDSDGNEFPVWINGWFPVEKDVNPEDRQLVAYTVYVGKAVGAEGERKDSEAPRSTE